MYLQQAYEGKNDWWRYTLTSLLVIVANIVAQLPFMIYIAYKAYADGELQNVANYLTPEALGISENLYFLLLVGPLVLVLLSLVYCIRAIHWHTLTRVFTSFAKFRWRNYFGAALVWLLLSILMDLISYSVHEGSYVFHFQAQEFVVLVIISLVFVPFQTAWEELYFRGNLMQGFATLFKYRIVALLLTSVLFGVVHFSNPEIEKFGFVAAMTQYIGFGILLGILVIMDGGLEMALGIHAINNFYSLTLVSYDGSVINTPAVFSKTDDDILFSVVAFLIASVIALLILKKIFKWQSFNWLFTKVEIPSHGNKSINSTNDLIDNDIILPGF